MTRAQSLRVSRERLIARLQERQTKHEANRLRLFRAALAEQLASAERDIKTATANAAKLRKVRTPDDVEDEYWARSFRADTDLARSIRLLELSDEDTISVGPSSNLWAWL